MLSVSHGHASLIELKLFSRDVYSPVDHGHEVALQLIDILERYSANRCDVAIGVESVVLHFRCHKHCDQNQSKNNLKFKIMIMILDDIRLWVSKLTDSGYFC